MLLKLIFAHLIGMGIVEPMEEQNDNRDLYYLYVVNHDTDNLFVFEHCYEEEILEYIDSGDFEYNEDIRYIDGEFVYQGDLTKNK
jgi:hypothetical protein